MNLQHMIEHGLSLPLCEGCNQAIHRALRDLGLEPSSDLSISIERRGFYDDELIFSVKIRGDRDPGRRPKIGAPTTMS